MVALRQKHLWLSGKSIAAKHIQRYCLQAVIEHELKTQTQPLLALMVCPYFSPAFLLCSYFSLISFLRILVVFPLKIRLRKDSLICCAGHNG